MGESLEILKSRVALFENGSNLSLLNLPMVDVKSYKFSALSLAFYVGNLEAFRFFYENKGLSVQEMEKNLQMNQLSALVLACEKDYSDLLEFYIPVYMKNFSIVERSSYSFELSKTTSQKTPVHIACELGHVSILMTIFNAFQNREKPPFFLNLHYVDEISGENCVFIACRKKNNLVLRCLFHVVKADFSLRNLEGKGCVFVLAEAALKDGASGTLECLEILVDCVGLAIQDEEMELLRKIDDFQVQAFVERKERLVEIGKVKGAKESFHDGNTFDEILNQTQKEFIGFKFIETELTGISSISKVEVTNDSISFK
jgi:hypothetical protein